MTWALTTEEVRGMYVLAADTSNDDRDNGEDFDHWFASEIEKAERRGEVLATARRIASENAELMRRLG